MQDEVLVAGFGRRGHAVGDIPGVRFKAGPHLIIIHTYIVWKKKLLYTGTCSLSQSGNDWFGFHSSRSSFIECLSKRNFFCLASRLSRSLVWL